MSGDAEQEYFSDGITEDIITDLSKISGLFVIARNSVFLYKGKAVNVPEICWDLSVKTALEGSIRKSSNQVRINAQLIEGASGGHYWVERYDRDLTDIFEVQDEVTGHIVEALKLTLTPDEEKRLGHKGPVNMEAYDLVLRARHDLPLHPESYVEARALFERAIEIDPDYALAHAGLALTLATGYTNHWDDDPEAFLDQVKKIVGRAVALADDEPHPYLARSIVRTWRHDLDGAVADAKKAIAIDPNDPELRTSIAIALYYKGEPEEAVERLEEA